MVIVGTKHYAFFVHNVVGLVPKAVQLIKEHYPSTLVATDVALDPYSSMVSMHLG